ncbi:monocarboxylate transporter 12-B-like [Mytilus galloprovincialis]|uniref:monocarboxylate transporter 12-B-like n=1 Tax=Mytilus galloprovincialis TaxID=29158 RepID=UPI003F7BBD0A
MTENEIEILSFELHEEDGTNQRCNGDEKSSRLEHRHVNVDSGWAWVVLAAATVQFCLMGSVTKGMGVFFNGFIDHFESSSAVTSIIPGVFHATYSFFSLPFLTIGLRFFSTRQLVITAGILSGMSFIIACLANSVKVLIFTYGVILGISFALLHGPVSYLIGVYFVKRRNLAQAICGSGFGLGGLIFPPIYTYLIEHYGLRGGLLLTGGVQLNIVAFALFLRPQSSNVSKEKETKTKQQEINENMTAFKSKPETSVSPEELQTFFNKKQNIEEKFDFKESIVCSGTRKSVLNRLLQWLTVIVDYTLFKHWFMRVYIGVFCIGCIGVIYNVIYIAPFAKDNNVSVNDVAILVSIVNTCDFIGRIMNGVITDRKILKNYQSVILTSSITAISMALAPLYTKYWHFVVYGVISGLNAGCLLALTPAIIGDFLGMENFRSAMGILMFGEGITTGLAAPFIGYLRDITGSYVASLYFMSACSLISAIIFIGGLLGKRHWTLIIKKSNDHGKRTSL